MAGRARGKVVVDGEECKGCGLCVESCPPRCLELMPELNAYGAHPARYTGQDCTGCGICYYCCPEPGAITVCRIQAAGQTFAAAAQTQAQAHGGAHAATV